MVETLPEKEKTAPEEEKASKDTKKTPSKNKMEIELSEKKSPEEKMAKNE